MIQQQLIPSEHVQVSTDDTDSWCTPPEIVALLLELWTEIDTDPCSNPRSIVPAAHRFGLAEDGLSVPWVGRVYCNPPYSNAGPWAQRCRAHVWEGGTDCEAVFLTHAAVGAEWYQAHVFGGCDVICFPSPRVAFLDAEGIPRPGFSRDVSIAYFGHHEERFTRVFRARGCIVQPR